MNTTKIKINGNLSLVGTHYSDSTKDVKEVSLNSNYIFIADNSGSMYGEINNLRKTLKREYRKLKVNDTLTLAHFSDHNNYKYFVKSQLITDNYDFSKIDTLVDKYLVADGLTCYTDVLFEAKEVIEDIATISSSDNFSLCFLSDGYPNDHSPMNQIISAIENIKGSINQSYIIGYGRYYNKPILSKMAETMGSTLIHNDTSSEFDVTFSNFISQKPEGKNWKIQLNSNNLHFYLNMKNEVILISGNEKGETYIPQTKLGTTVWEILTNENNTSFDNIDAKSEKYLYGAALVLSQNVKTWYAMNVLSSLGDVYLLEKLNSAFTTSQYGNVETLLAMAIKGEGRFIKGKKINCLPDPNAFSFLDLLDILEDDDSKEFYPNDPSFKYRRRGKATEKSEDSREFNENKNDGYKIENITLNKTRPNVSLLIRKEGKVQLDLPNSDGYKLREKLNVQLRKQGKETIPNQFPTHVFRNYSIITDGDYNMTILPLSINEDTYNRLKIAGVIPSNERYGKNKIFKIDLSNLPIASRKWGKDSYTTSDFAEKIIEIQKYKVEQSVYNYFIKFYKPNVPVVNEFMEKYGEEGMNFLKERDITPNGYSPKVSTLPAKDFYLGKEFEISVKSFSSISVPSYIEKIEKISKWDGKGKEPKLTISESTIDPYYKHVKMLCDSYSTEADIISNLTKIRNQKRNEMRLLEKQLNTDKLIFLMTNSDFSDVKERGDILVPLNEGYQVNIKTKETPVYF